MFELEQEITLERSGSATKSTVRGWNLGGYFLLDIPTEKWNTGDHGDIICRLLSNGTYFGFTSSVIGIFPEIKMMALKYPEDIIEGPFKRGERREISLPVTVYKNELFGGHTWPGIIVDISKNGCRLLCEKKFEVDETLSLRGRFPTGGSFEKVEVFVKNRVEGERQFAYGGQMSAVNDDENTALEKLRAQLSALPITEPVGVDSSGRPSIPIGITCQAQIGETRYNTAFRGALFPRYILLDVPFENEAKASLSTLSNGTVRFLNSGKAYGFESRIVKQYHSPVPLLAMEYPDNIEKVNLRKSERIKTFLPGRINAGEDIYIGAIIDLSEDGCLFTTKLGKIASDMEGALQVELPGGETLKKLHCVVKNVWTENKKTNVGLVFNKTDHEDYLKIRSFYNVCAERLF